MSLEHAKKGDILISELNTIELTVIERLGDILYCFSSQEAGILLKHTNILEKCLWTIKKSSPEKCAFETRCGCSMNLKNIQPGYYLCYCMEGCAYCKTHKSFDCDKETSAWHIYEPRCPVYCGQLRCQHFRTFCVTCNSWACINVKQLHVEETPLKVELGKVYHIKKPDGFVNERVLLWKIVDDNLYGISLVTGDKLIFKNNFQYGIKLSSDQRPYRV